LLLELGKTHSSFEEMGQSLHDEITWQHTGFFSPLLGTAVICCVPSKIQFGIEKVTVSYKNYLQTSDCCVSNRCTTQVAEILISVPLQIYKHSCRLAMVEKDKRQNDLQKKEWLDSTV
jgi:hypothetical protein